MELQGRRVVGVDPDVALLEAPFAEHVAQQQDDRFAGIAAALELGADRDAVGEDAGVLVDAVRGEAADELLLGQRFDADPERVIVRRARVGLGPLALTRLGTRRMQPVGVSHDRRVLVELHGQMPFFRLDTPQAHTVANPDRGHAVGP